MRYAKIHENVIYKQRIRRQEQTETAFERAQTLDFADTDFSEAIVNMFNELKETVFK